MLHLAQVSSLGRQGYLDPVSHSTRRPSVMIKVTNRFWTPDIILNNSFQSFELRAHILTCPNGCDSLGQCPRSIWICKKPICYCLCAFGFSAFLELRGAVTKVTIRTSRSVEHGGFFLPPDIVADMILVLPVLRGLVTCSCCRDSSTRLHGFDQHL